jgi:hypothetical protein
MTWTDDWDTLALGLSIGGAVATTLALHMDLIFQGDHFYTSTPNTASTVRKGTASDKIDPPTMLEGFFFMGGWAMFILAAYFMADDLAAVSGVTLNGGRAWALVSTLCTPIALLVGWFFGGGQGGKETLPIRTLVSFVMLGGWISFGLYAGWSRPNPFQTFGIVGGPLVALSSISTFAFRRRTTNEEGLARFLSIAPVVAGKVFIVLALARRPI